MIDGPALQAFVIMYVVPLVLISVLWLLGSLAEMSLRYDRDVRLSRNRGRRQHKLRY